MLNLGCITVAFAAAFAAAGGNTISGTAFVYQGQLKLNGRPVEGPAAFEFTLFDAELDGRQVAEGVRTELVVRNGLFSVELDFGAEPFRGERRWLEISVRTERDGATLTPRQPITPAPFALYALDAGRGTGSDSPWQLNGSNIYYNAGKVGIGVTVPQHPLHAQVDTASGHAVHGLATATANTGVGVFGQSDAGTGRGVIGYASSSVGVNFAVVGQTDSADGYAGYFTGGRNHFEGETGFGTLDPQYPVHAELNTSSGRAIFGLAHAAAPNGTGVQGEAQGERGKGLVGNASGASGVNFGVVGSTSSSTGYAGYFLGGRNYFQGRVGIGTNDPAYALDVNGEAQANSFRYAAPREMHLTIGAYAFHPAISGIDYRFSDGLWATSSVTSASFVAPVTLPQGAVVTGMTAHLVDLSTPANMTVLLRYSPFDGTADTMAEVTYVGSAGFATIVNTSITPNLIDNLSNTYYVVATCDDWPGFALRLKAVVVAYTVEEVD